VIKISSMHISSQSPTRITSLDALRGVAALIVVFNHLQHAFLPNFFEGSGNITLKTWYMVPIGFFLNGGAAVSLFFVLSGFVLTQRFFESGTILTIPDSILKRWPRLAGPVIVVSLISGFLMGFGFYYSFRLSSINGAYWLAQGLNWEPRGLGDLFNALQQGSWGTFYSGVCDYNGPFWTMHFELMGSFVVYLLVFVTIIASSKIDKRLILIGLFVIWIREIIRFPFLGCFVLGTILAFIYTNWTGVALKSSVFLFIGAVFCIVIGGFTIPENNLPYKFCVLIGADSVHGRLCVFYFIYSLIALFSISAALWAPKIRDILSKPFLTKLGHLSFPIYLIHTPIICSIGAWLYLVFCHRSIVLAIVAACLTSLVLTFVMSIPLAAFDDRWLLVIRRISPVKTIWGIFQDAKK